MLIIRPAFHPDARAYDPDEPGAWHVIMPAGDIVDDQFYIVLASFPANFGAANALGAYAKNNYRTVDDLRNHAAVSGGTLIHFGLFNCWWSRKLNHTMPRYEVICDGVSRGIYEAPESELAVNEMCKATMVTHPREWHPPARWQTREA